MLLPVLSLDRGDKRSTLTEHWQYGSCTQHISSVNMTWRHYGVEAQVCTREYG
jgi:hypothetical protein